MSRLTRRRVALSTGGAAGLPAFAYQAETEALAASFGAPPTERRKQTYDRAFRRLKGYGILSELHGLWTAGANATDSRRNIVAPGTYDLAPVGSPTFTANDGWIASNTTNDSLNTGIPLSALNAASCTAGFTCPTTTEASSDSTDMGVVDGSGGLLIRCKDSSSARPRGRAFSADTSLASTTFTSSFGLHAITRSSSTVMTSHHSGVTSADVTAATVATTNGALTIHLLKANGAVSGSGRKFRTAFVAKRALTQTELRQLHAVLLEMETAIAWGEPTIYEAGYGPAVVNADVVCYGADAQGVMDAYSAKRYNPALNVIIVGSWEDRTIGGMSANGLGLVDFGATSALSGLPSYLIARIKAMRGFANGTSLIFEPRMCEWVCREMLDPTRPGGLDIPIYWSDGVVSAQKTGARGQSITTADGRTFNFLMGGDNGYDGDFAPVLNIPYVTGREAAGSNYEGLNGFRGVDTTSGAYPIKGKTGLLTIDPYNEPGNPASGLIRKVHVKPTTAVGAADNLQQAYTFRQTWNNQKSRSIPFDATPPEGYDVADYEILLRMFAADPTISMSEMFKVDTLLNGATDTNSGSTGFSTDDPDGSQEYLAAGMNYTLRKAARRKIANYVRGLIYLICYDPDPRIPAALRTALLAYGWDAYHYGSEGLAGDPLFFPRALYVREHRRIRGDLVWNGNDIGATDGTAPRSLKTAALAAYAIDSHYCQRFAELTGTPRVVNEGGFLQYVSGANNFAPLPYEIFLPSKADCENVTFSFATSSTHAAFGSIRMELTSMMAAQFLGIAKAMAISTGQALQDLDYSAVRAAMEASATLTGEITPYLPQTN